MATRSELNRNGFQTVPVNRKNKKGGGLALTIKDNIKVSHENSAEYKSFEHAIWNISHKTMPTFIVVAIYHPHPLVKTLQMLHLLINSQTSLRHYKPNTIT